MTNQLVMETELANGLQLQLVQGDITKESVEAIVNAANERLQHGGGVAAAIARAGGRLIQKQSNEWVKQHGPLSHDQAAVTSGGDLASRYVIHVVGPRWGQGNEAVKLRSAVTAALAAAEAKGCQSLALPAISTGIFGYPVEQAAEQIVEAIKSFRSEDTASSLRQVRIILFDQASLEPFSQLVSRLQEAK